MNEWMYDCMYQCMNVWKSEWMHLWIFESTSLWILYVYVYVKDCKSMCKYVYVCTCMYMYVYVCICMYMYVYVCICMYMYVYVCESWWRVSPTRNVWAHGSWTYTLSYVYKHIQYIFILVWLHTCLRMSCSACIYVQFWGWINQVGPTNRPGLPWLQGGPNPCSTPASSAWTPARVNHQLLSAGGIYSVSLSDIYIIIYIYKLYIWRLFWDSISHLAYQLAFYLASYLTYTQTLWHFVWHIFWHFIWHSVWLSDIYFDILHDLLSDIYSDIHFDILNLALHLAF